MIPLYTIGYEGSGPDRVVAPNTGNVPLTNVSVAYMQDKGTFIADKIFPRAAMAARRGLSAASSITAWKSALALG